MFIEASLIYVFISSNSKSCTSKIILLYNYTIFILLEMLEKAEMKFSHLLYFYKPFKCLFKIIHILMP